MAEKEKELTHFQKIGKLGGKKTAEKNGPEYMRKIGKRGGKATKAKYTK
jgi:general stress protein YciG